MDAQRNQSSLGAVGFLIVGPIFSKNLFVRYANTMRIKSAMHPFTLIRALFVVKIAFEFDDTNTLFHNL